MEPETEIEPLPPEALYRRCDPHRFTFNDTGELPYKPVIIGQDRAVEAIKFGLNIPSPGFNIFVIGPSGTGRHSILRRILEEQAAHMETPSDWVYVNHFTEPASPRAIRLPPGMGRRFRADMERFNTELAERLQQAFETDQYAEARERLDQKLRTVQLEELSAVEQQAREAGFALVRSPSGLYLTPTQNGDILSPEAFSQLPVEIRTELEHIHEGLQEQLNAALRRIREYERRIQSDVEQLDREVAAYTIDPLLRDLTEKYAAQPEICDYLREVRQDIVDNVAALRGDGENETEDGSDGSLLTLPLNQRYRVNVLVDNGETQGAPVIFEETPTYDKLFGRIEYDMRYGMTVTDYTLIRPGALHRANGGFLVLDAEALLEAPYVWAGLKRALFSGLIRIEPPPDGQQLVRTVTPEPEPIPLHLKVILRGAPATYYALHDYDADFTKHFKVQADFSTDMPRTAEAEWSYAYFIRNLCADEELRPFTPQAVARVVEFGARLAGHQHRLTLHFGRVADLVREASYWAGVAHHPRVRRQDVLKALHQRKWRANRSEELDHRDILEGRYLITVTGRAVGEINGLTVISLGSYSYGLPCRITARAYVGRGQVIDIHREINLSGPFHHKGVLTLAGYFRGQYGHHHPPSMEASLNFEQTYSEIEGDSASAAELYALLSALARIPLRQDLAVTGAVDQHGRILPIGGVNEKIEGMFAICRARGLTGTQGVIIPARNTADLMLTEEVIAAVEAGQFHIYPVATVDEGLTLLTGMPPGRPNAQGEFPPGTFHAAVAARLRAFAEAGRDEAPKARKDQNEA